MGAIGFDAVKHLVLCQIEKRPPKLIYLAIRNFEKGGRNVREWFAARNQFDIMFAERFHA